GFGSSPLPQEGDWTQVKEIKQISGLSHGVGKCAPQQGACKLSLNVKNGVIKEALVECIGCSGMTHSAAMAGEILCGKTLLEALNTDLVCDAINDAMKNIFFQLVYGRSQSAFSLGGLPVGACLDDLGKDKQSKIATIYSTEEKGTKYLNTAEGYISKLALDENGEIIGYEYIGTGKLIEKLRQGISGVDALKECTKEYGRYSEAKTYVDPRK
ncbi:MAG: hypothetical protein KBT30_01475, partial [Clostridiales bacterium]|nr:hypothetical protein [Candidatus Apopatousia equi]